MSCLRSLRAFTGLLLSIPLACGPAGPADEAPPEDDDAFDPGKADSATGTADSAVRRAYLNGTGAEYMRLVRARIDEAHHLSPGSNLKRLETTIAAGQAGGFDGLESLVLLHFDCTARTTDSAVQTGRTRAMATLRTTKKTSLPVPATSLKFLGAPKPQLPERFATCNGMLERTIDGRAVRTLLQAAVKATAVDTDRLLTGGLRSLLAAPVIKAGLCALPARADQHGRVAQSELVRVGTCTREGVSGGAGAFDRLCQQLEGATSGSSGGADFGSWTNLYASQPAASASLLESALGGADNVARLRDLCAGRGALSGGAGRMGVDPLDGFASSECMTGTAEEVQKTAETTNLLLTCVAGSMGANGNPLADGGEGTAFLEATHVVAGLVEVFIILLENVAQVASDKDRAQLLEWVAGLEEGVVVTGLAWAGLMSVLALMGSEMLNGMIENSAAERMDPNWCMSRPCHGEGSAMPSGGGGGAGDTGMAGSGMSTGGTTSGDGMTGSGSMTPTGGGTMGGTLPGSGMPGFDPQNPACRELANRGYLNGRKHLFDDLFDRSRRWPQPNVSYPTFDSSVAPHPDSCGASGGDVGPGAQCSSLVMCSPGTQLDRTCQCVASRGGPDRATLSQCAAVRCANGVIAQPAGRFGCQCGSDAPEDPHLPGDPTGPGGPTDPTGPGGPSGPSGPVGPPPPPGF